MFETDHAKFNLEIIDTICVKTNILIQLVNSMNINYSKVLKIWLPSTCQKKEKKSVTRHQWHQENILFADEILGKKTLPVIERTRGRSYRYEPFSAWWPTGRQVAIRVSFQPC